jgi:hypothetical protein
MIERRVGKQPLIALSKTHFVAPFGYVDFVTDERELSRTLRPPFRKAS